MGSKIYIHPYFHKEQKESEEPGLVVRSVHLRLEVTLKLSKTLLLHQQNKENTIYCISLLGLLKEAMNRQ